MGLRSVFCWLIAGCAFTFGCSRPADQTSPSTAATQSDSGAWKDASPQVRTAMTQAFDGFVIVPQEPRGVRDPAGKFYPLGMPADDFVKAYRQPDAGGPAAWMDFRSEGLKLQLDQDRKIAGFLFFPEGRSADAMKPAKVMVSDVISNFDPQEMNKRFGKPLSEEPASGEGKVLTWPWGYVVYHHDAASTVALRPQPVSATPSP
jgi:hypothetical protein